MATPVPVVSMMYFLLSTPPKTFFMVSPAFSAMSTKLATCWEALLLGDRAETRTIGASRIKARNRSRRLAERKLGTPGRRHILVWILGKGFSHRQAAVSR